MTIVVNGAEHDVAAGCTVGALVDARAPDRRGVAVAVDGAVIRRVDWDTTTLDPGARVEIVGAVQGG